MTFNSELRSGIALGIAYFLWLLMEYYLGFHTKYLDYLPFVFWIYSVIPTVGINWALKAKRDRFYHGKINFFQAFRTGFSISVVMALVSALMKFIYVFLVNPLYYDLRIDHDKKMIDELDIAKPDKDMMINKIMTENALGYSMFETLIFMIVIGTIITLTVSILIKKDTRPKNPEPPKNEPFPEVQR
ncbi:MAG: DUF4199 domain-containing protein [Bacteroidia bacterium]